MVCHIKKKKTCINLNEVNEGNGNSLMEINLELEFLCGDLVVLLYHVVLWHFDSKNAQNIRKFTDSLVWCMIS